MREDAEGERYRVFATQHWGSRLGGHGQLSKNVLVGEGADVVLLGVVGKKGMLEWGNIPDKVPMDTENTAFKTNGEVYSNVGDRTLKHELQMQGMAANMEGIMQIIAHKMDTSGKTVFRLIGKSCSVREEK